MKVIIVDDEPKAIELITSYLDHFSNFQLVATFRNGLKALEFLNSNTVDVIFLDINMPHLNGISLSKMTPINTDIVFTTAYSEHAVESYNVNTIDYLLKPISLERFSKTIGKLIDKFERKDKMLPKNNVQETKVIFVKSGLETHQIKTEDILYLQKDGNYIYYYVNDKKIMARESITEALSALTDDYIQVQKSYIVHLKKIDSVNSEFIKIGVHIIPIGNQFKSTLLSRLGL